jgi:hypothetical protein
MNPLSGTSRTVETPYLLFLPRTFTTKTDRDIGGFFLRCGDSGALGLGGIEREEVDFLFSQ